MKPTLAISLGDFNGIGPEIALKAHVTIKQYVQPLYFTNFRMLRQAAQLLNMDIPEDFEIEYVKGSFTIHPGKVGKKSGAYSFRAFQKAVEFTASGICDALVTLPIHKEAWMRAGIKYKGHTDYLRHRFKKEAIMMLGCPKMYVALFTEHIPLKDVVSQIKKKRLKRFLINLANELNINEPVGVLGLNPHAGDNGALGDEERIIKKAIHEANKKLEREVFVGPLIPDVAFTPKMRERFQYYVAMYHDQGLIPLKTLYFEEGINVSLNLPILRTSVDHGTAFDIAYRHKASITSYLNAVGYIKDAFAQTRSFV